MDVEEFLLEIHQSNGVFNTYLFRFFEKLQVMIGAVRSCKNSQTNQVNIWDKRIYFPSKKR